MTGAPRPDSSLPPESSLAPDSSLPRAGSVLVVRPLATGGLAAHVDHEVALLREIGVEVHESAVQIPARPHPAKDLRTVRTLRREIVSLGPRAVHAHGLRAGALAALAARPGSAVGPRLVVTLHNRTLGSRAVRMIGAVLLRIIARRADTVLCVSPDLLEDARSAGARDARHAVIPAPGTGTRTDPDTSPVPADPLDSTAPGAPAGADAAARRDTPGLDVLVLARLAEQKGLGTLLDAAARLRDSTTPIRIRIAGEGPLRDQLSTRIRAEELSVDLLGHRTDVPALLAAADLVVSSARWEGQPVGLQEALRAGRAIVATDAGGTRWVTGEAAQLVPVGDPGALAAAILRHADPQVRRRAEEASRDRADQLPTDEDLMQQLLDVLALGVWRR